MIYRQIPKIVNGTKIQTRRIVKPGERLVWNDDDNYHHFVLTPGGRVKWRVGQDYAVVPKRGYHGVYYDTDTGVIYGHGYKSYNLNAYASKFVRPLRIKILSLYHEPLKAISKADADAEGVDSIAAYMKLWNSINNRNGIRWCDNPPVWVIKFEVLTSGRM